MILFIKSMQISVISIFLFLEVIKSIINYPITAIAILFSNSVLVNVYKYFINPIYPYFQLN